jgi:2,4-dienoyl-CoA reductase (NADPH2)
MFFNNLFSPIEIEGIEVPNRLISPAMHTNLGGTDVGIAEKGKDYLVARAKGGFGMVCVGIVDSYPWDFTSDQDYLLSTEIHVENHREVVDGIQEYGSVPVIQTGPRRLWPLDEIHKKQHRCSEINEETIHDMIDRTVDVAINAEKAGYEAVELIGIGGGALSFFLSKRYNDRDDKWGGSIENRLRFPRHIIEGIHDALGDDYPVFFRIHGDEFLPDGYTLEGEQKIAKGLDDAGVSFFNVTGGSHATSVPQLPANVPRGAFDYLAKGIGEAVSAPVAASNRINDPQMAERIVRDGWADMVSLGRQSLADPEWPNKVREGRLEDLRECIACNECLDYATVREEEIRCLVNPKAGRGLELEGPEPADERKDVLVVGGGVVGLHAALCCDERGHQVTVYEKEDFIGGNWRVSYAPSGREELYHYLEWLTVQLNKSDVEVRTGIEVDPDFVRERAPDVVLICAGGVPNPPSIPGTDRGHVHYVHEVLTGNETIDHDSRVAVVGGGGAGLEAALYFRKRFAETGDSAVFLNEWDVIDEEDIVPRTRESHDVTLIGRNERVGVGLGASTKWVIREETKKLGVETLADTEAVEIRDDGVVVEGENGESFVPADAVVLATGYKSDDELLERFEDSAPEVRYVGDITGPGHAIAGIGRAQEVALEL